MPKIIEGEILKAGRLTTLPFCVVTVVCCWFQIAFLQGPLCLFTKTSRVPLQVTTEVSGFRLKNHDIYFL